MKTVNVPHGDRPVSALDGIRLTAVDSDPAETIGGPLYGMEQAGQTILGVLPVKFHGARPGYLIVSYDPKGDVAGRKLYEVDK